MELRVLKYFLAIAREGSLTKASAVLNVTQPTISRQIQDLESELGQRLFDRGNKTLALTPEGVLFRRRAEEILELTEKTRAEFSAMGGVLAGDVHIGCAETKSFYELSLIFAAIQKQYPDVHFHLYSGNDEDVLHRLDSGILDFGVLLEPFDISRYSSLRLPLKERWGLILLNSHPLARQPSIKKEELYGLPLIFSRQAQNANPAANGVISWFGDGFPRLNIVATFNMLFNAVMMVKAGVGSVVSIDRIITSGNEDDICFRPFEPPLESRLAMIWKKDRLFSNPARLLLERMESAFDK